MSTDKSPFAPKAALSGQPLKKVRKAAVFINFLLMIALCGIWAYYSRTFIRHMSSYNVNLNSGGADFGTGPGSGNSGDGPGAGASGSGKGKFKDAKGFSGIGKTATEAGTDNPAKGLLATDGTTQKQIKVKKIDTPPLHIESIARKTKPVTPTKITAKPQTGGTVAGRKGFYGVDVNPAKRVLFIVDTSGSMGFSSREDRSKSRMDILKMELLKIIRKNSGNSGASGGFSIVSFSSRASVYPNKGLCMYSHPQQVLDAEKHVKDALRASGITNMRKGWEAAVGIIKKQKIDTVYFLSDGEPSDGFEAIWLNSFLQQNNITELTVNTISIGINSPRMKAVARDNMGKYIYIP